MELWEDERGVIPQHITGLYLDSRRPVGTVAGLQIAAGAGLGATIENQQLEALDLLNPHSHDRKLSLSARVAYLPDFAGTSAIGVLWAYNAMAVESGQTAVQLQATDVRQDLYGVFVNWAEGPWQLRSALYDVNLRLQGSPGGGSCGELRSRLRSDRAAAAAWSVRVCTRGKFLQCESLDLSAGC